MFRKSNSKQYESPVVDKVAGRIATVLKWLQTKFAVFVTKRTARLSAIALKLILLCFCACWIGVNVYFIVYALGSGGQQKKLNIRHFSLPAFAVSEPEEKAGTQQNITKLDYQIILRFREFMDSLKLHDSRSYNCILMARPGLIDSVDKLEQIYNHQKK